MSTLEKQALPLLKEMYGAIDPIAKSTEMPTFGELLIALAICDLSCGVAHLADAIDDASRNVKS